MLMELGGAFLRFDKYPDVAGNVLDKAGGCENVRDSVCRIFEGNCKSESGFSGIVLDLDGSGLVLRFPSVFIGRDGVRGLCRSRGQSSCSLDTSRMSLGLSI